MSVAVTDEFMQAVEADGQVELWHAAEPFDKDNAARRADGTWAYRRVRARDLFDQMMRSTYDHAEPGVVFIDRVNRDNNLSYCESIAATNPCVPADTWVMTTDGPRQVEDLIGGMQDETGRVEEPRIATDERDGAGCEVLLDGALHRSPHVEGAVDDCPRLRRRHAMQDLDAEQ